MGAVKTGFKDKRVHKAWYIKQIVSGKTEKVLEPLENQDLYRNAIAEAMTC